VSYVNKAIAGSPFHCQVFDWAKINVSKLPQNTVTDRVIDFDSKQLFGFKLLFILSLLCELYPYVYLVFYNVF